LFFEKIKIKTEKRSGARRARVMLASRLYKKVKQGLKHGDSRETEGEQLAGDLGASGRLPGHG